MLLRLILYFWFIVLHSFLCHNTLMDELVLNAVPPGRWGIGVSGGADSVALLLLMQKRADVQLHLIHLDHETRQGESAVDAAFAATLAAELNLPCTIEKLSAIEASIRTPSKNTANRFRNARLSLFVKTVANENLLGMLLAHHADDQAETILMKVMRGSSPENLSGMRFRSNIKGMQILRPLLNIPGADLRKYLREKGQPWREDSSNQSDKYQRNRLRHWLADKSGLTAPLMNLQSAAGDLRSWLDACSPRLAESFSTEQLNTLPSPLAKHAAQRWLIDRGVPANLINSNTCDRLIEMATDAASPRSRHFPGGVLVKRSKGVLRSATPSRP